MEYISGDYRGKVIYILLAEKSVAPGKFFLEEVINVDQINLPYISCYLYGENDLYHLLPLCAKYFSQLLAIWDFKKRISRSNILLMLQYQWLISAQEEKTDIHLYLDMLRRIEDYDRVNGGNIKETMIKCVLQHDMDYKKMATDEYVHYNTIKYRMRKVEEILHIDLRKAKDISMLYGVALVNQILEK